MFSIDEDFFKEQILPRLLVAAGLSIAAAIAWFCFFKWLFVPTPMEIWQQQADSLPAITTDSEITAAILGEPRTYLVKNYKFADCNTISDTVFRLLKGDYMAIDIRRQVHTATGYGKNKTEQWTDHPYKTIVGGFQFNDGTEILNADALLFGFTSQKYWGNLTDDILDPHKLGHVSLKMYYFPDMTVNYDSLGSIIAELPERLDESVEKTKEQMGKPVKTYNTRYTLTFMTTDDPATFAVRLGGGKADFHALPRDNYMLVGCDNISEVSNADTTFGLGAKIALIIGAVLMLLVIIFAPKIFGIND